MKKSELRQIIKEELIKETAGLSLFKSIDDHISDLSKQLQILHDKTKKYRNWSNAINVLQQEIHKFRALVDKYDKELGLFDDHLKYN